MVYIQGGERERDYHVNEVDLRTVIYQILDRESGK